MYRVAPQKCTSRWDAVIEEVPHRFGVGINVQHMLSEQTHLCRYGTSSGLVQCALSEPDSEHASTYGRFRMGAVLLLSPNKTDDGLVEGTFVQARDRTAAL